MGGGRGDGRREMRASGEALPCLESITAEEGALSPAGRQTPKTPPPTTASLPHILSFIGADSAHVGPCHGGLRANTSAICSGRG